MTNRKGKALVVLDKIVDIIRLELAKADVITQEVPDTELRIHLDQLRRAIEEEPEYVAALEKGHAATVPIAIQVIYRLRDQLDLEKGGK